MSDIVSARTLQKAICGLLEVAGYINGAPEHVYFDKQPVMGNEWVRPVYFTEIRYGLNIYGTPGKLDFLLINDHSLNNKRVSFAIVAKYQKDKGTVDEKFPFLVQNIYECYGVPTIVVLDGGGYRPGAEKWLRAQVRPQSMGLIAVCNFSELQNWVEDGAFS